MKIYWSKIQDETKWELPDSIWFLYAEKFMTKFPRLAVRVFWLCMKIKEFWQKIRKFFKLKIFDS